MKTRQLAGAANVFEPCTVGEIDRDVDTLARLGF